MALDLSALRTELLSSAQASTYSASVAIGDDNMAASLVNTVGSGTITIGVINAPMLQQAVVGTEYIGLTQVQRDLWGAVLTAAINGVSISNAVIRAQIGQCWSAATVTRGNLSNLQIRTASRAELLFGEGVSVTANDVNKALHP